MSYQDKSKVLTAKETLAQYRPNEPKTGDEIKPIEKFKGSS